MWAAILTGSTVAFFTWAIARTYEIYDHRLKSKAQSESNIRALYAEVDFNTRDMEIFLKESSAKESVIRRIRENSEFIPHVTDARHTEIYRSRIPIIHNMGEESIGEIVYFYGLLAKIGSEINGIYLPSYKIISGNGRCNVIVGLYDSCEECHKVGVDLLQKMAEEHPHLRLIRARRRHAHEPSDENLSARMHALSSDLDRARASRHDISSS